MRGKEEAETLMTKFAQATDPLERNRRIANQRAAALPQHWRTGPWHACQCGYASCNRVHPSAMGIFVTGTGFSPDEARLIVKALESLEPTHGV